MATGREVASAAMVPSTTQRMRPVWILAAVAALAITLAIYVLRLDRVVGLIIDDAWYVLLAKALATGNGYTLINSPTPGIAPFYPPGFPALLSLFYRISPEFPANVWLLKSISIAAMIGVGIVAFRHFAEQRALAVPIALALGFATAIYPALVFLATSTVMSECVFTFAQLSAIYWIERSVRRTPSGEVAASAGRDVAIGAALAAFAFLTRSAGIGVLVGAVLYLVKERLPRQAMIFATVAAIGVGPWMLYARQHVPSADQRMEQGGSIVMPYTAQLWQRVAGRARSGTIEVSDLPERIWNNLNEIVRVDVGAFVSYASFRPLEPGETMSIPDGATWVSMVCAMLALAGYVAATRARITLTELVVPLTLAVSLTWGWEQYRLLLPLTPFVFYYLLLGVRQLLEIAEERFRVPGPRAQDAVLLAVACVFVASGLYANARYLERKRDPAPERGVQWIRAFAENESFMQWVGANVPGEAPLATDNPALLYLYTGRSTIASNDPWSRWRAWRRIGVRYVVKLSPYPVELDAGESSYPVIHRHDGFLGLVLFDLGPPETRPDALGRSRG